MARLAEQFVCVRLQSMNGVNINLFQFDFDLTWMAFFMDDRDRLYARYGGREDEDPESHLNKGSLLRVMEEVQQLHRHAEVQTSRYEPDGKARRTPEEIPTMKAMLARRKENKCIHCHDVKVAQFRHLQAEGRFQRDMIFAYPTPTAVGLGVDRRQQNRVTKVAPGSAAAAAGLRPGDILLAADGQRLLTLGDFSRVLEQTPPEGRLPLEIERGGQKVKATLELAANWRRSKDPSWRESLHVAGPGAGFWGNKLNEAERRKLGIPANALALRVTFIWAAHARRAGLKQGDVVVEFDGLSRDMTIRQLHAHLQLHRNHGDAITLAVHRGGQNRELKMQLVKD